MKEPYERGKQRGPGSKCTQAFVWPSRTSVLSFPFVNNSSNPALCLIPIAFSSLLFALIVSIRGVGILFFVAPFVCPLSAALYEIYLHAHVSSALVSSVSSVQRRRYQHLVF